MLGLITLGLVVLLAGVMIGWIFVDKLNQCFDELATRCEIAFDKDWDIVIRESRKKSLSYTVWLKSKRGRDWFLLKVPAASVKKNLGGTYSVDANVLIEAEEASENVPNIMHYCR